MTCYVDDITISGKGTTRKLLYEVRQIIGRHGLNTHKAKYFSPRRPKVVTGVVVANDEIRLPHRRHLLIKNEYQTFLDSTEIDEKLSVLNALISRIHEAAQIDSRWLPKAKSLQHIRKKLFHKKQFPEQQEEEDHAMALEIKATLLQTPLPPAPPKAQAS
jgi:hypothetical protein